MIIIVVAVGWGVGLLLAAGDAGVGPQAAAAGGLVVAGIAFGWRSRNWQPALWVVLAVGATALGEARYRGYWDGAQAGEVARLNQRSTVRVRGVVADDAVELGAGLEFPLAVRQVEEGGSWIATGGTIMVEGVAAAPYRVGDRLEVAGVLLPPDPQVPPNQSPLRQQGIDAVTRKPAITPLGSREESLRTWIASRREDAAAALDRSLPEPEAGLARGIALGERRTLGSDLAADFQRTNTSHILAVDGYKVGLVAAVFASALGLALSPALVAAGTVLGIAGYVVFVGASPSALRAGIMGGIFALGRPLGRPNDTLNALAVAALLMTALSPLLLWNLAFQLSFATTLGLAALAPVVDERLKPFLPGGHGTPGSRLRDAVGVTLAAEIASAPLVVASFDQVSVLSLPVHAVVMPLLPFGIGLAALTALGGVLTPGVGSVVGLVAWLPLAAIVGVVRLAGEQPFAAFPVPPLGVGWTLAAYAALGLALLSRPNSLLGPGLPLGSIFRPGWQALTGVVPTRLLVPALLVPVALGTAVLVPRAVHPAVAADRISFLNVSGGDAALLELTDGGRVYLQGDADATRVAQAIEPGLPPWDRRLDLAVISGGDDAALTQLGALAGRLTIRRAMVPTSGISPVALDRWQRAATSRGIAALPGEDGTVVRLGDASLTAYALEGVPARGRTAAVEPSLAVALEVGPGRVLWASALPADQARLAARGIPLSASVLKLVGPRPSWGLDASFFRQVNPSVVILPAGAASQFAKPTAGTLDLLGNRQVYRTDLDGTVVVEFGEGGMAVRTKQ